MSAGSDYGVLLAASNASTNAAGLTTAAFSYVLSVDAAPLAQLILTVSAETTSSQMLEAQARAELKAALSGWLAAFPGGGGRC
ncbi:hypothetical protein JYJ95_09405 [Corallococcus exiguus]|uniref:hypothetical protein n=1 Tax=Corallococcus exiguus TaxID=83462 RepID=UPI001A90A7A0|nr:hypothetical protein [Corallococcus exiguus]MBN8466731.1 hypothetical protein [Corallococcus exiguus]